MAEITNTHLQTVEEVEARIAELKEERKVRLKQLKIDQAKYGVVRECDGGLTMTLGIEEKYNKKSMPTPA